MSNLSETEASTALNLATDWGQEFTTGSAASGYKLQSVTLDFSLVNPSANITVSIREKQSNNHPATTDKAALTGTPATGQVTFTCSGAGCNLNASTTYFVFVTGGDSVSNMKSVTSDNETLQPSGNGWSIENATRYQGGNWALHPQGVSMRMKVEALGHPSLAGSNVSTTGATLTLSQHTGNWYYKDDTAPHTSCQGHGLDEERHALQPHGGHVVHLHGLQRQRLRDPARLGVVHHADTEPDRLQHRRDDGHADRGQPTPRSGGTRRTPRRTTPARARSAEAART